MFDLDLALALRNVLLLQFLITLLLPEHAAVVVHRHLVKAWRSLHAPFLVKKHPPKKGSRFWEIDMTKFEP
jgi:hypothetical protein